MSTNQVKVRVVDPDALRGYSIDGGPMFLGREFDAHPVEARFLVQFGLVQAVDGAADVRGQGGGGRPERSGKEFATSA